MKTIARRTLKSGKVRLIVELDADEDVVPVSAGLHYQLGFPVNDVVGGHIVQDAVPVAWCSVEQKWVR